MKRPLFWHRFHHAEYLAKTLHLTAAQRGAHISLVCRYWVDGKLPADDDMLARIVGMSPKEWKQNKAALRCFFEDDWRSPGIDAEIAEGKRLYEKQSAAGRKANADRWGPSKGVRIGSDTDSDSDPIYSTAQNNTAHEGPSQGEGTPLVRYSSNLSEGTNDADRRPRLTALAGGLTAAGKEDGR